MNLPDGWPKKRDVSTHKKFPTRKEMTEQGYDYGWNAAIDACEQVLEAKPNSYIQCYEEGKREALKAPAQSEEGQVEELVILMKESVMQFMVTKPPMHKEAGLCIVEESGLRRTAKNLLSKGYRKHAPIPVQSKEQQTNDLSRRLQVLGYDRCNDIARDLINDGWGKCAPDPNEETANDKAFQAGYAAAIKLGRVQTQLNYPEIVQAIYALDVSNGGNATGHQIAEMLCAKFTVPVQRQMEPSESLIKDVLEKEFRMVEGITVCEGDSQYEHYVDFQYLAERLRAKFSAPKAQCSKGHIDYDPDCQACDEMANPKFSVEKGKDK